MTSSPNPSTPSVPSYRLAEYPVGSGSFARVFVATDVISGSVVAVKKYRVSLNHPRPLLRHESRMMQILQGHPSVPRLHGYAHPPHFEYIALELLGQNLMDSIPKGKAAKLETVVRIALQMLDVLSHLQHHGIVHRDIKPDNILCSLQDPSRVVLIDYGISIPQRSVEGPALEGPTVVGSVTFASLNALSGKDLCARDDLEALAYSLFYLFYGDLPWHPRHPQNRIERRLFKYHRVRNAKARCTGAILSALSQTSSCPEEFGLLFDHARACRFGEWVDYPSLIDLFQKLSYRVDGLDVSSDTALDWTPVSETDAVDGGRCDWSESALQVPDLFSEPKPSPPYTAEERAEIAERTRNLQSQPESYGFWPSEWTQHSDRRTELTFRDWSPPFSQDSGDAGTFSIEAIDAAIPGFEIEPNPDDPYH